MEEKFKKTNTYKFLNDLIYDITEAYRTNENKNYDFNKTIDNLMADDDLWQELTNAIWRNLVEIKGDDKNE